MRKGYVDLPEGQMHYRVDGQGPSMLLLHQSPLSGEEYAALMSRLAADRTVYAIDYLGHGCSDDPPYEPEIVDYARQAVEFMDAVGVAHAILVGHHTGALVAVELAAAYPDRVTAAVLSGCPVFSRAEWDGFLAQPMSRDFPIAADGEFLMRAWGKYQKLAPHVGPGCWFGPFIIAQASRFRPYDAHFAAARHDTEQRLRAMRCPTLLVSGEHDMFVDQLASTQQLIADCRTSVVSGGGLFINFEVPEAFATAILDFLKTLDQP